VNLKKLFESNDRLLIKLIYKLFLSIGIIDPFQYLRKMYKCVIYLFFVITLPGFGQAFHMELKLTPAVGETIYLAQYYLGNIYAKDTLQLDHSGYGVFKADSLLPQGLYKIYLDQDHHFDILLGSDQQFRIKNNFFQTETMQVEGSEETAAFIEYTVFLKKLKNEDTSLRDSMEFSGKEEREALEAELAGLTEKLHDYWDQIQSDLPGSFLARFVQANYIPVLDVSTLPEEVRSNDTLLFQAQFQYQQEHFWDHFDYTDERFLYTPFFKNRVETWFTKVLFQNYDSVKKPVIRLIEEVRPNKQIFQFVTSYFLNSSINSSIMGMDALFVDLARKYYLSGDAYWVTEETLSQIRDNVRFIENNLIGALAPDLTLEGFDGEYYHLHQVDAKYTLVLVYEPGCSHCNDFVPDLYSAVYQPFKEKGLEVFAIYSMDNKEEWGEFLTKHKLFDWINVWDEHHASRFKILYDARKTPGVYVLDENKTIVAKGLSVEQLKFFLEQMMNEEGEG